VCPELPKEQSELEGLNLALVLFESQVEGILRFWVVGEIL